MDFFGNIESNDPGDETQRNFRYQNAYGVILLVAAGRGSKPYAAIWCEHHEDLVAECNDGTLDAYQIKTRRPEEDLWDLRDEPLWKSIKGFVNLYRSFQERIRNYYFVSNVNFPKSRQFRESTKPGKYANNPAALFDNIHSVTTASELDLAFTESFRRLAASCECSKEELFTVLKQTFFIPGPSRQDFDAVIANEHLAKLSECSRLSTREVNTIRDELVLKVYQSSSLFIDDPDRHVTPLQSRAHIRPEVNAKRIPLQTLFETIATVKQRTANVVVSDDQWDHALCICHTAPEDNEFAKWLSFQLINAGYSVWCDLISIKPGSPSNEIAQEVIENKAGKFLFILTEKSVSDPRSLEQLEIAYGKMKSHGLEGFILPIRLSGDPTNLFFLRRIFPVDFSTGWAQGMKTLLELLVSENYPHAKDTGPAKSNALWQSIYDAEQGVFVASDEYLSNWFKIESFPNTIKFHKLRRVGGYGSIQVPPSLPYPTISHNIYLVSFADAVDFTGGLGNVEICQTEEILTKEFLAGNYDHRLLHPKYVKKFVIQLVNQAWENFISNSKLRSYQMANGKTCYYYHQGTGDAKVSFSGMNQKRSWRYLWGYKTVLGAGGNRVKKYWHYGITGKANSFPEFLLLVKAHVLFSDDAVHIWDSKSKLHAARRSWCNNWWNSQWRDRLLAIMTFLANDQPQFSMPVGNNTSITVQSQPISFNSPISYLGPKDQMPDDDDQDMEVPDLDLLEDFPYSYQDEDDHE